MKLKDVWKHVKNYNNKANEISQHYKKGKNIVNCSETYQDQAVGSLIAKDEAKRSKRMRSTNEEGQVKSSGTLEKKEDHSLLSKITIERPQKKRRHLQWTPDLDKKLDEDVRELGEKGRTIEMVKEATTQGVCLIFQKSSISAMKLKDVWKHVKNYNNKANEISQNYKVNQVYVMNNTSCPKKVQDRKGKNIVNCSETYQDQ
ncbi:hypothetical protein H5410_049674 [Solanum commersonii]|uniref:Uncharacterized protein n=1 Tax=Solanum commersonii TaxID=4109 RepID=A0A9J5WUR6_SOLCO|nr:hypothetical protein H5410_049674 [Solanum commersonii]